MAQEPLRYHSWYLRVRYMLRVMSDGAVVIPASAWRHPEAVSALRARDAGAVLRFAQHRSGASQARLAAAIGLGQGRVNELVNNKRQVQRLDLFERIADGLAMPDSARMMLGLAPAIARQAGSVAELADAADIAGRSYRSQYAAARSDQAAGRRGPET